MHPRLLVGPVLRHVAGTRATVFVEVDRPCEVQVRGTDGDPAAGRDRTWTVHDHHYALVVVTGLVPGRATPYEVLLDGVAVWPEPGSSLPPKLRGLMWCFS